MRAQLLGWLLISMLLVACSRSADVSGHVIVTMPSGDVRRGADLDVVLLDVVLLEATETVGSGWKQIMDAFQADRDRAVAAVEEAETAHAQALADRSSLSSAWLGALLQRGHVDWQTYDRAAERLKATDLSLITTRRQGRKARAYLKTLVSQYRSEAWGLIQTLGARRVRTDAAGRFEFKGAAPGRYVLVSRFRVSDDEVDWLVPLDLKAFDPQVIDLTLGNAGWPFS